MTVAIGPGRMLVGARSFDSLHSRALRWLLRAPTSLYSIGGGRVLGYRFLLLEHRGRQTGRRYRTVLEVLAWRSSSAEAVVMSGFGATANWYRNVLAGGALGVHIAGARFVPEVRRLDPAEPSAVLADYERRNRLIAPLARAVLSRLSGVRYDGSEVSRRQVIERLPLVAFTRRR